MALLLLPSVENSFFLNKWESLEAVRGDKSVFMYPIYICFKHDCLIAVGNI